jgi:hypothetical protein
MFRKIALVLLVVILPAALFAAEEVIGKDNWSYKDIKDLVDSGVITKPLDKDTLTRSEAVEYIDNGVQNVLYADASALPVAGSDLTDKINKLYELVKAYMTDMMKTEQKLDDILNVIGDLKAKKKEIEMKQDRLLNGMGMRINGESSAYMTDLLLYGSKYGTVATPLDQRYRPITQYIDLKFSLHARKDLYAEATLRLENLFGAFWGSQDIYGLRRFFIQADMPVSFIIGGYQGKLTPFTLWAGDDSRPFESKIISDKRDMNKNELYLLDDSWPLEGAKVQTIMELFDTLDVNLTVLGARLAKYDSNTTVSTFTLFDSRNPYGTVDGYIAPHALHDQFLIGGRMSSDFTLKDVLNVGVNYVEVSDSRDTGVYTAPMVDNYVFSLDGNVNIKFSDDFTAKVYGESAGSWYTGDKGNTWTENIYDAKVWNPITQSFGETTTSTYHFATDSALKGGLSLNFLGTSLDLSYKNVGNSFTAYAAQTRIYAQGSNYYYVTQNNTWNINNFNIQSPNIPINSCPIYMIGGQVYPLSRYNPSIITARTGIASIPGNLLEGVFYENNTNPYGDATPDRQGFKAQFKGDYGNGIFQPMFSFESESEPVAFVVGHPRVFSVVEGGAKSEFGQFVITAGYKSEDTENGATGVSKVALTSSVIDFGVECELIPKKLSALVGFKQNTFNGTELMTDDLAVVASYFTPSLKQYRFDHTLTTLAAGINYQVAKPAIIGFSFSNTQVNDNRVVTKDANGVEYFEYGTLPVGTKMSKYNSFGAQEFDVKVSIFF